MQQFDVLPTPHCLCNIACSNYVSCQCLAGDIAMHSLASAGNQQGYFNDCGGAWCRLQERCTDPPICLQKYFFCCCILQIQLEKNNNGQKWIEVVNLLSTAQSNLQVTCSVFQGQLDKASHYSHFALGMFCFSTPPSSSFSSLVFLMHKTQTVEVA